MSDDGHPRVSGVPVREFLGMDSPVAAAIVALFSASYAFVAATTLADPGAAAIEVFSWLVVTAGALILIRVPGDPMPMRWTLAVMASGPVALGALVTVLPVPVTWISQLWPLPAMTAVYAFLCARGRIAWAWFAHVVTNGVCVAWAVVTGQGLAVGVSLAVVNLAPLLMGTFFSQAIRPAVATIFRIRRETMRRAAAEAASVASVNERDRQLARLDEIARPALERIAGPEPLTAQEKTELILIERHLRDCLRAPALVTGPLADCTREARRRGVDVLLLDDHGLADCDRDVVDQVLTAVAGILDRIESGSVAVRVLPPGRRRLVTVVHRTDDRSTRVEFDTQGRRFDERPALDPGADRGEQVSRRR